MGNGAAEGCMDDSARDGVHDRAMQNTAPSGLPQRVGLLVPGSNTTVEAEMNRAGLPGLSFHAARMTLPMGLAGEALAAQLRENAAASLQHLSACQLDAVMLGCTSAAMALGADRSLAMMQAAQARGTLEVGTAIIAALRATKLARIALFTPYLPATNASVIAYLAAAGIETVASLGLGLNASLEMFRGVSRTTPAALEAHLDALDTTGADGVLICCTDLPTVAALPGLEARIGKPVVSSNQAMIWAIARQLGQQPERAGGSLFAAA